MSLLKTGIVCALLLVAVAFPLNTALAIYTNDQGAVVSTVGPSKDFGTLSNWWNFAMSQSNNLGQWAECYSGADLGKVTIDYWASTPSPTNYVRIYAAEGERHNGRNEAVGAYAEVTNGNYGIFLVEPYTRLEGLRVEKKSYAQAVYVAGDHVLVDGVMIRATTGSSGGWAVEFGVPVEATVQNCIIYSPDGALNYGMGLYYPAGGLFDITVDLHVYHNTIHNANQYGFLWYFGGDDPPVALNIYSTNNVVTGSGTKDYEAYEDWGATVNVYQDYCVSSDGSADYWGGGGDRQRHRPERDGVLCIHKRLHATHHRSAL